MTKNMKKSERELAAISGLARGTVRKALLRPWDCKVSTLELVAKSTGREFDYSFFPETGGDSEYSVVCTSLKIHLDGFDSWRVHIMNFVDEFRRSRDRRLLILPPIARSDQRLLALYSGIVRTLCKESKETSILLPRWARKNHYCEKPWFVSGVESLKASAILESPIEFRSQNIFVHANFLSRV